MKNQLLKTTLTLFTLFFTLNGFAQVVRFETNVGDIEIELYADEAPITVQNFLNYVNRGDYDDTVIHRTVPGFVIQGGGYRYNGNSNFSTVATDSPIVNESSISNTTGTIAMARTTDPNSATNQWFFNLADNTDLDETNNDAGFAVFGKVSKGMDVLKIMESFLRINFSSSNIGDAAGTFPIFGFFNGNSVTTDNVVVISRAYVLSDVFQINAGLSGAWFNPETNGQGLYLEVLPSNGAASPDTVIVGWYTFNEESDPAADNKTIGDASNRWLTASGSFQDDTFVGNVFTTSGGLFDNPQGVTTTDVGSMSIVFNDCATAVFSYSFDGSAVANTMNIQRISGANLALCESLASAANQGDSAQ